MPTELNAPPRCERDPLVEAIAGFLAHKHAGDMPQIRASLRRAIDAAGADAVRALGERMARAGSDWDYYPRDPLARRIHHLLAPRVLQGDPLVTGTKHLEGLAGRPLVIVANHLSYSDANVVDVLLQRAGGGLADRLTVVAGPKVYSSVLRRFSSLCFGTIKVPQSAGRSSDEAVMPARDVARAARRALHVAEERLSLGEALLVFAEGSRSRTGRMQQLLSGVARYLEAPETLVLPIGLAGTEKLFPIDAEGLGPGRLAMRVGRPAAAAALRGAACGNRRLIMDSIGLAIAALVPREYRGVYGDDIAGLDAARDLARNLFD